MSVIINADDFGKDRETNLAVEEAFEKGYITHPTLMVNMPAAKEAARVAKEKGFEKKVGLHLNLTEGMPLSLPIRDNPLICSSDGSFNQAFYHNTRYRLYMDSLTIRQIETEFRAQLEEFLALGFSDMHIDSHHHVHTNYPVYLALKGLSGDYSFSYIRQSRNLYRGGSILNRFYKRCYNHGIKKLCRHTTALFGSYGDLEAYMEGKEDIRSFFETKEVEIMVHPMYREGVLMDTDRPMEEETLLFLR